jgi:hypothetical protein
MFALASVSNVARLYWRCERNVGCCLFLKPYYEPSQELAHTAGNNKDRQAASYRLWLRQLTLQSCYGLLSERSDRPV